MKLIALLLLAQVAGRTALVRPIPPELKEAYAAWHSYTLALGKFEIHETYIREDGTATENHEPGSWVQKLARDSVFGLESPTTAYRQSAEVADGKKTWLNVFTNGEYSFDVTKPDKKPDWKVGRILPSWTDYPDVCPRYEPMWWANLESNVTLPEIVLSRYYKQEHLTKTNGLAELKFSFSPGGLFSGGPPADHTVGGKVRSATVTLDPQHSWVVVKAHLVMQNPYRPELLGSPPPSVPGPVMELCDLQNEFGEWNGHYVLRKQVRTYHRFPSPKEPDEHFERETTTFEWHDLPPGHTN